VAGARLRLVQQLAHLAGALSITVAGNDGANGVYNRLTTGFAGCIETVKTGLESEVQAAEGSLGGYLELYTRGLEAENAMLLRRTGLMVDWEHAGKAVEKARPNREEAAKLVRRVFISLCVHVTPQVRDDAEKELAACSEVARGEVKLFHHRRLQEFRQALVYYAEVT
jgi:sorting nexin-5/6/32